MLLTDTDASTRREDFYTFQPEVTVEQIRNCSKMEKTLLPLLPLTILPIPI